MPIDLAPYLDHTLLRADARAEEIDALCGEALEHRFAAVCVNGTHVPRVAAALSGSAVRTCAVAAFPLGASSARAKAAEVEALLADGAEEVDAVQNVGALLDGDTDRVRAETAALAARCHGRGATLKLILECCLLDAPRIELACRLAAEAGADWVKTSTGFAAGGATVADVERMRRAVGDRLGVKAAGGIRDATFARALVAAGATRLGTSSAVALVAAGERA